MTWIKRIVQHTHTFYIQIQKSRWSYVLGWTKSVYSCCSRFAPLLSEKGTLRFQSLPIIIDFPFTVTWFHLCIFWNILHNKEWIDLYAWHVPIAHYKLISHQFVGFERVSSLQGSNILRDSEYKFESIGQTKGHSPTLFACTCIKYGFPISSDNFKILLQMLTCNELLILAL